MSSDAAIQFRLVGARQVSANLRTIARKSPSEFGRAAYAEAEIEMTEARLRTPVDTGVLRASGYVAPPEVRGQDVSVELGFNTPYAVAVHENLESFHKVGQAKYLESVLVESAPFMAARIAKRVDLNRML